MFFEFGAGLVAFLVIGSVLIDIYEYFENAYHKSTKNIEKLREEYDQLSWSHQIAKETVRAWWDTK